MNVNNCEVRAHEGSGLCKELDCPSHFVSQMFDFIWEDKLSSFIDLITTMDLQTCNRLRGFRKNESSKFPIPHVVYIGNQLITTRQISDTWRADHCQTNKVTLWCHIIMLPSLGHTHKEGQSNLT